jgi:hypothetical protein
MTLKQYENKGDWAIFRNTVPKNYDYISCSNTVSGICKKTDTLDECIKECEDNSHVCNFGYYISSPVKYCLPINNYRYPHFNPILDLVPQESIPKIKGINVTTFINRKSSLNDPENPGNLNIPDPYTNTVYFKDQVYLKNVETQTSLYTPEELITDKITQINEIYFNKDFASTLTVNYPNPYNPGIILNDLVYNDLFVLRLGNTNLIFRNFGQNVGWISRGNIEILSRDLLRIRRIQNGIKPIHISYGHEFYIEYGIEGINQDIDSDEGTRGILGLDGNNKLKVYNDSFENLQKNNTPVKFTFESKMSVYYCENNTCKELPQSKLEPGKSTGLYNGKLVYRSPDCFGLCSENSSENSSESTSGNSNLIFFALAVLLLIYLILLWVKKRN